MEWMCAECGKPHPKNSPPCNNCGAMQFEKTVVRQRSGETDVNPTSVEWECTECGRSHPKNSPPCSRCGNMQLESVERNQPLDSGEISAGIGLSDVMKFAGALVVVGVLIFGMFNAGVLSQSQAPTVENVPGDANYSSGLDLSTVEYQIYDDINEERSSEGYETLPLEPKTADIAEYYNKKMVKKSEYPLEKSSKEVFDQFGSCSEPNLASNRLAYDSTTDKRAIDRYANEKELARALSSSWLSDSGTRPILLDDGVSSIGIDVHVAEDGSIYATVTFC
jgi:uncharacterized protein YkwD